VLEAQSWEKRRFAVRNIKRYPPAVARKALDARIAFVEVAGETAFVTVLFTEDFAWVPIAEVMQQADDEMFFAGRHVLHKIRKPVMAFDFLHECLDERIELVVYRKRSIEEQESFLCADALRFPVEKLALIAADMEVLFQVRFAFDFLQFIAGAAEAGVRRIAEFRLVAFRKRTERFPCSRHVADGVPKRIRIW
jgi:hypothetical protein